MEQAVALDPTRLVPRIDLAEIFITASVTQEANIDEIFVTKSDNNKCGRCWRLLPEVVEDGDLCNRCADVVGESVVNG